jgi:hypothetical protein
MSDSERGGGSVDIFAGLPWYEERAEPEHELEGVLEQTPGGEGPGDRATLAYTLHSGGDAHRAYAAGVMDRLARISGRKVRVRGRLIDLRGEGGVVELWIGSIAPLDR